MLCPMRPLPDIVSKTLSDAHVPALRNIVIGVSGGADSTALAMVLMECLPSTTFVLAHIDHSLPEAEAPQDGVAVRTLAQRLDVAYAEERVDVRAAMALSGESLEMAARRLRHEALLRIAYQHNADAIALGHNADDQVETMILRLARGTGPRGLGGIAVWQPGKDHGPGLLRPLLDCSRESIRAWLQEKKVAWREDPTNADDDVLRNRVRHHVLPALYDALGESARNGFLQTAALLRNEETNWLDPMVESAWRQCHNENDDSLDVAKLRSLPPALRRRVILRTVQRGGVPAEFQTREMLERLTAFATQENKGSLSLDIGGGYSAQRVYGKFQISNLKSQISNPGLQISNFKSQIPNPTRSPIRQNALLVEAAVGFERTSRGKFGDRPLVAYLSRAKVPDASTLFVRPVREGDRLHAIGATGSTKISDILIDRKVPRDERGLVVVVCMEQQVVWLPGHSIDADFAVEGPCAPSWKCTLA